MRYFLVGFFLISFLFDSKNGCYGHPILSGSDMWLDSATQLYANGDLAAAIRVCNERISRGDKDLNFRLLRGMANKKLNNFGSTLEDLDFIIVNAPDRSLETFLGDSAINLKRWALDFRGTYYMDKSENEKALADMTMLYLLDSGRNAETTSALATLYYRLGNATLSDSLALRAFTLDSSNVLVVANVGLLVLHTDRPKAIYYLSKALSIGDNAVIYMSRALVHSENGDLIAADRDFQRSIEMDPDNGDTYVYYAAMLRNSGRHKEYCANLEKALSLGKIVLPKFLEECK